MITLTLQLRKIAKKTASHPSNWKPDIDLRKLVNKLEQTEIIVKLMETENLQLQHVNNVQTTTSQINKIQDSDTEVA